MSAFPQISSITWREISANDSEALAALDRDCKRTDGDEPVSNLVADVLAAATNAPADTLCGVRPEGQIAALTWIKLEKVGDGQRVRIWGRVQPDFRRRGLGTFLVDWAEDRAHQVAKPASLVIASESLTADADKIYTKHGFAQDFAENMMVRDLGQPIPDAPLPDNVTAVQWTPDTMGKFFAAYSGSFADRPGFPNMSAEAWFGEYDESDGFRPDLSRVALAGNAPVGFVTCDILAQYGWIGQVGVIPMWRASGLADALLVGAMKRFKHEGLTVMALHVNVNNPRAARVYERLGFMKRLQRARYVKRLTL
jgi:ribosomal protein S18 acetylase RimI-like enzyme